MAALGWQLNLGFAASDAGGPATRFGDLLLLGVGRCWWWLAPLAWLMTGSCRF